MEYFQSGEFQMHFIITIWVAIGLVVISHCLIRR